MFIEFGLGRLLSSIIFVNVSGVEAKAMRIFLVAAHSVTTSPLFADRTTASKTAMPWSTSAIGTG